MKTELDSSPLLYALFPGLKYESVSVLDSMPALACVTQAVLDSRVRKGDEHVDAVRRIAKEGDGDLRPIDRNAPKPVLSVTLERA